MAGVGTAGVQAMFVGMAFMAMAGLFREGLVEWITAMTYQAASGQGAPAMRDLVAQMARIGEAEPY